MVTINFGKKHLVAFSILILFLAGVIVISAFGTNSPSTFGHSIGEIDWTGNVPQLCLAGVCKTSWSANACVRYTSWGVPDNTNRVVPIPSFCLNGGKCIITSYSSRITTKGNILFTQNASNQWVGMWDTAGTQRTNGDATSTLISGVLTDTGVFNLYDDYAGIDSITTSWTLVNTEANAYDSGVIDVCPLTTP